MKPISKELSTRFANMSLLCAFLVVLIHVFKYCNVECSLTWWLRQIVGEGVCRIAVPFFFLAAGYFISCHNLNILQGGGYFNEIQKRIKSLMIPFFTWCFIAFSICSVIMMIENLAADRRVLDGVFSTKRIFVSSGIDVFSEPELRPLWFLRTLFGLVLIAPLLNILSKRWVGVAACFAVMFLGKYFANHWCPTDVFKLINIGVISVEGVAYFTLGMALQNRQVDLMKKRPLIMVSCIVIGALFVLCNALAAADYMRGEWKLIGMGIPFVLTGVFLLVPCHVKWSMSGLSFPIYLVHMNVLFVYAMAVRLIAGSTLSRFFDPNQSVVGLLSCVVIVVGITLAFCKVLHRLTEHNLCMNICLWGGRG